MKKTYLSLLLVGLFFQFSLRAQQFELTPFSGYTFKHSFDIYGGEAAIEDGHTFGGMLGFLLSPNYALELLYSRQLANVTARSAFLGERFREDAAISYILVGGSRVFPSASSKAQFTSGLKLGVGILSSPDNAFSDEVKFAASGNFGFKYFFVEQVGLSLGSRIFFPIIDTGASLWWSPGGGTQVGVSTWSPIVQLNLYGGLVFRLGNSGSD